MDLNDLFVWQQVERSRADSADDSAERNTHEALARLYELAIERKTEARIIFPWRRELTEADPEAEQLIIVPPIR